MKKYRKPLIAFENFELATSMAAGCTITVPDGITEENLTDSLYEYNGVFYFTSGNICRNGIHDGTANTIRDEILANGWNS